MAWGGARPALAAKTSTPSPPSRTCSVGGRLVLDEVKRARGARLGIQKLCSGRFEAAAAGQSRFRCKSASAHGAEWSASHVGRKDNHAKYASAHVLWGRSAGSRRGEVRAGRARQNLTASIAAFRSRSRRHSTVSVKKNLGQRRGVVRAPRWPQRQPRQVRQRVRALWAVGWFSTGQSARGPRPTQFKSFDYDRLKPQAPIWRGVGEEERRPTEWGKARPALAAKTITPSPPARTCYVGGRPVLHGAKRTRAARLGIRKLWLRPFEDAAADLGRCR